MVVYVLLTGQLPYTGQTFDEVQKNIRSTNPIQTLETTDAKINPIAISFMKMGMEIDQNRRGTAA